ncbi:B12-binding domain-containing radical SAM protein [Meridianimarinicoccus sp. MJW13]|uniref:B12-binding domain-containing radical SAM protein n=1 Tax=Meridianimarinicoccus sp. MJW13 TaxID=2720031 RepID=UPI001866EBD6|nr:radical SAM protein [Fluviibacterium sp. MJW13]
MPRILLVYPRFSANRFMGHYDTPADLVGAKAPIPPLGLLTVAALLPKDWPVRFIDRTVRDFSDSDLEWADLVFTGGMLTQQRDAINLIEFCQSKGKRVVVGGPDASASPHLYSAADYLVIGEAEGVMSDLVAAIDAGEPNGRFEAETSSVDMTQSPLPRFDLLDLDAYMEVSIQVSRGCPFTCEFCDVIEMFGRVPRVKSLEQLVNELHALLHAGYRGIIYIVDDNFIGNKKAVRAILPGIADWQKQHGYPFQFYTSATINIADDASLLEMLREARIFSVFIGFESPDDQVLMQTRKKQNMHRDFAKNIARLGEYGIFVTGGFIIGFDEETDKTADAMLEMIRESGVAIALVHMLYALPRTQLSRRLAKEKRLSKADQLGVARVGGGAMVGLNFETIRPREEILRDFRKVISELYDIDNYCRRMLLTARLLHNRTLLGTSDRRAVIKDLRRWGRLVWRLSRTYPQFIRPFGLVALKVLFSRPRSLKSVMVMMAMYTHLAGYTKLAIGELDRALVYEGNRMAVLPELETT